MTRVPVLVSALLAVTLVACSSSTPAGSTRTSGPAAAPTASAATGTITVFAAASLTEAFTALAKTFEAANPGVQVKLDFGASSALALQINQGAPADVFASAAPKNMQQVVDAGGASAPTNFVKNVLAIAVPPKNPAHITGVGDLARNGVKVAVCQPQVPCGAVAQQVFANAKIKVKPVTFEADVKSTLSKVELGEVDAGVVYVTDVHAAGSKVTGVQIPAPVNASTEYPIAALRKAKNAGAAQAFVAFVLSARARSVLIADGFQAP